MKKFVSLIAVTSAILILGTQFAHAENTKTQLSAAEVLPESIVMYYELDLGEKNPLESLLTEEVKNDFLSLFDSEEAGNKIIEMMAKNKISIAMNLDLTTEQNSDDPEVYLSMIMTAEDLDTVLTLGKDTITKSEYKGHTIYTNSSADYYAVHIENLLIATPTLELLQTLIDNYLSADNQTLAKNEGYINARAKALENNFIFMYIDPSFVTDSSMLYDEIIMELPQWSYLPELMKAITTEGVSVLETDTGFDFSVYVEATYEKLKELDMLMNKFNFVPKLYKEVSGKDIILYSEQYNLALAIKDTLKIISEEPDFMDIYDEFKTSFTETTGYKFETDLLPLFTGNYLFAIHNDENQIIPAVTMIFESSADHTKTLNMLSAMSNTMKTEFEKAEKESNMEYYSYQIMRAGGASFYQHRFDLTALLGELSVGKNQIFVVEYTIDDNNLVISTHSNLDSIYGKDGGLIYNKTFDSAFTNRTEEIASISFLDFRGLENYIANLMGKTKTSEEDISTMKKFLTPWHSLFSISYATANTTYALVNLDVDVNGFGIYEELINSFKYDDDFEYEYPEALTIFDTIDYCDVSVGDWYYPFINNLTTTGIVSGYTNGCFGPNDQVTRAEFTKMVIGAAEWNGVYVPAKVSNRDIYFKDVPSDEWYWNYINQAATNGFVKGYADDTFRPSSPIARSEAVQILYNISPNLQAQTGTEPFNDVSESDWYYKAVTAAYNAEVISGSSPETFDPNRNLTRAEASKIVANFMFLY